MVGGRLFLGKWSVVGGRWSVVLGRWSVVGGRCHSGQWSVVGGWSVGGGFVLRLIPGIVLLSSIQHKAETVDFSTHALAIWK